MSFPSLGLSPLLTSSLRSLGYSDPTPVQLRAIPPVLAGDDVIARAHTGTGKTAAFGLPIIDRLFARDRRAPAPRAPRGLVLVPTRELAVQVHRALALFGAPFYIFLLTQFYKTLPEEMAEAARLDGASEWRIFSQLVLPLSKAAL